MRDRILLKICVILKFIRIGVFLCEHPAVHVFQFKVACEKAVHSADW